MKHMNTLIQTSIEPPQKDLLAKPFRSPGSALILIALALACSAVSPAALAGNPHGSPTPTVTPTPTPSPTPIGDRGNENTAIGDGTLFNLTSGVNNTAMGFHALFSNTIGNSDTANGYGALFSNTTGLNNTAIGTAALYNNTTGDNNTATGFAALYTNTIGVQNTATGLAALFYNTTGNYNTAEGVQALEQNTTSSNNTATGFRALYSNSADNNTAYGYQALLSNTTGSGNTAVGTQALLNNTTGGANVALGYGAGQNLTTGLFNIDIGSPGSAVDDHTIRVGQSQTATYIAGIREQTASGGVVVYVDIDGKLGTATSSARFKDQIKPMDKASEAILALKPVTFRYKKEIDSKGIPQFGLVAEEVEKVNSDLVVRDKEGKPYTVRYDAVNAMLLNEFLKEHKRVEEQEVTISDLKKDLGVLTAQLKEQAAEIQKVSAQVEMRRPLTRLARSYP